MAMPNLSAADLEKLKFFINFVSENPTVLNLPQLQFVKEFVEKLGGTVPAGEFKMPAGSAGGKCPFGGNASPVNEGASGMNVDESEESDLDESDPESEVELDMEAETFSKRKKREKESPWTSPTTSQDNFVDTSAVYLEETKVVGKKKGIKTEREQNEGEEYECQVEAVYGTDTEDDMGEEDPIKTNIASVPMKYEAESDFENDDFHDENYKSENDENEDVEDEDEDSESSESHHQKPVRRITRSSTRSKKSKKKRGIFKELKYRKKVRKPKPVGCIGKCKKQCDKVDEEQRKKLCREFWALSYVERKNYLLTCVERKPLGKMRIINRKKEARQHTNHYFVPTSDGERVRVCLDFFLKTLAVSGYLVKDALENSDDKGKYIGVDCRGGSGEGRRNKIIIAKQQREKLTDEVNPNNSETPVTELNKEQQEEIAACVQPLIEEIENSTSNTPNEQKELSKTNEIVDSEINLNTIESNKTVEPPVTAQKEKAVEVGAVAKKPKPKYSRRNRIQRERKPQPVNCAAICRFKCHTKFTEEQRVMLCAAFWRLDYKRRKDFVLSRVEIHENTTTTAAEYRKTDRVRTFTNRYFLRGERGENVRVCARFFNATLNVGCHFLANAQRNIDKQTGAYAGEDLRGKRTINKNKYSDELIAGVREHINSYPTWVPHKNYKTRFLHSSLNIKKMWVEYKEDCERQNKQAVSASFFRNIFHKDFKLAFLQAKSKHAHKVSSQRKCNDSGNNNSDVASSTVIYAESTLVTTPTTAAAGGAPVSKKINPNISTFTGEEGGFWSQLTPNATETMRFLQQRYAPQPATAPPVIMSTVYHQQQQNSLPQQQQPQLSQQQQQIQQLPPIQRQLPAHSTHSAQPALLQSTTVYQFPQIVGYMQQPHIMNAGYDSEDRVQNFHLL